MFTGAKMRLLKWSRKKHPVWKMELAQPSMERGKIIEKTMSIMTYLETLREEYTKILDQLLEQLPTLSESGDDKNSLIQQKIDVLKKNLKIIERGLDEAQIFLNLNNIVENIETEVRDAEEAIRSLKDNIKTLKSENHSLRIDLSLTQRKLIESEEQVAVLEVERDQMAFMSSLSSELPYTEETSDEEASLDLSFIDEEANNEPEVSFPNLPCLVEIDSSLNPRLKIFYNLVMGYIAKGSYEIAAPLCKTTLQDLQEKCGPNHPDVVAMMDIITLVYRGMKRYKDAAKIQIEVLEIKRKTMGENNISIALTLNTLSAIYGKMGKVQEAETFCRHAVECRKRILGENHPDVAKQLCNLAAIYFHIKQYEKSVDCYKDALNIFLNTLGANNYYTTRTRNNLASIYVETEAYTEAEKMYKEMLISWKELEEKQESGNFVIHKTGEGVNEKCEINSDIQSENATKPSPLVAEIIGNLRALYEKTGQVEELKKLQETYKYYT